MKSEPKGKAAKNGTVPPAAPSEAALMTRLEAAARQQQAEVYVLRLYVRGTSPVATDAINRVRAVCEEHLKDRYQLEVIDIYQLPALAKGDQIVATPTLIKVLPAPLRRLIGNLTSVEKVLFGLDLRARR